MTSDGHWEQLAHQLQEHRLVASAHHADLLRACRDFDGSKPSIHLLERQLDSIYY